MEKINALILWFIALIIKIFGKNKLIILNYHRIQDKRDLFFDSDIDPSFFDRQMHLLSHYLTPLNISEALTLLINNDLPGGAIVVTFDDGYRDNFTEALPILSKYKVPAVFYIATDFLNGGIMWNDVIIESIKATKNNNLDLSELGFKQYSLHSRGEKITAIEDIIKKVKYKKIDERIKLVAEINRFCEVELPNNLMMNDDHVVKLHQHGMEIGGHTCRHPILTSEEDSVVIEELAKGKQYLETLLNTKLTTFAYPNGKFAKDYSKKHTLIVKKAGFKSAVTTNWGVNKKTIDPFQLYRFSPWDKKPILFLLRLLKLLILNKA